MVPKKCSRPGCDRRHDSRGLCAKHRYEALRSGEIQILPPRTPTDRFWQKVEKADGCWEWIGAKKNNGYGHLNIGGKTILAHRYSFYLANGPIPEGLMVDHMCHNRACVRPEHLRLVTMKQNQENRIAARSDSGSGLRGVRKVKNRWQAVAFHEGKHHFAGSFGTREEALAAVREIRLLLFTHSDMDRTAV